MVIHTLMSHCSMKSIKQHNYNTIWSSECYFETVFYLHYETNSYSILKARLYININQNQLLLMMTSLLFLHSVHVENHSIDLLRLAIADVCYETARTPLSSEPSTRNSMGSALLTRHRNAQNWAN